MRGQSRPNDGSGGKGMEKRGVGNNGQHTHVEHRGGRQGIAGGGHRVRVDVQAPRSQCGSKRRGVAQRGNARDALQRAGSVDGSGAVSHASARDPDRRVNRDCRHGAHGRLRGRRVARWKSALRRKRRAENDKSARELPSVAVCRCRKSSFSVQSTWRRFAFLACKC